MRMPTKTAARFRSSAMHDPVLSCRSCGVSFRFTLVLLCAFQVIVSVGVVWYLGYASSVSIIGSLSTEVREAATGYT